MGEYSSKEAILWAHKICCPYHHDYIGEKVQGVPEPLTCGSGNKKCDSKCWYMEIFERALNGALEVNPE